MFLGHPTGRSEGLKLYPLTFFTLSSVIGKASTIDMEISPIPPLIFTGGQKVQDLGLFATSLVNQPTLSRRHLKMIVWEDLSPK